MRGSQGNPRIGVHLPALRGERGSGIGRRGHRRVQRHGERQRRCAPHEGRPARRARRRAGRDHRQRPRGVRRSEPDEQHHGEGRRHRRFDLPHERQAGEHRADVLGQRRERRRLLQRRRRAVSRRHREQRGRMALCVHRVRSARGRHPFGARRFDRARRDHRRRDWRVPHEGAQAEGPGLDRRRARNRRSDRREEAWQAAGRAPRRDLVRGTRHAPVGTGADPAAQRA